ncbi:SnoaL-like domain protein [Nocardioides dokdonensis FR1436]|uniref:SnoaL-like domain protein n=1 Tax=Nocardioides dokdonensis FR1436 TaxID=1300347 RepID=A0A1A9GS13_9ACTN|nr:nuclear transport factor 2 family protein [Nocardioides dokdonensis]ANH40221.1 SnoaL-like domain protein [Nocardioides dokdonensis FR1436]
MDTPGSTTTGSPAPDPTEALVLAYWAAAEAREWTTFSALLAADLVCTYPQTRERVRGREAWARYNREYPGDWHLSVTRVVARGRQAVSEISVAVDGESWTGITFFDLDDQGLVAAVEEWWPDPYEPPSGRAHLVERY